MGGSGTDAFAFSALSVPFIVLFALELTLALVVTFTRGNDLIRAAVLAVIAVAAPWTIGSAITGSCNDPAIVERFAPIYVGLIALLGPALMLVLLAVTGRFERHRGVLAVATGLALISCVICWTTDLVVAGAWQTPWGLWYPRAGLLNDVHLANFAVWAAVGVVLVRRGARRERSERQRLRARRLAFVLLFVGLGATDGLLARGTGVYPFSVVTGCVATVIAMVGIVKHDLLQSRGFDRAAAYEFVLIGILGLAVFSTLWLIAEFSEIRQPFWVALLVTPLLALAQLGALVIRARSRGEGARVAGAADRALEEYVAHASHVREEGALAGHLAALLTTHTRLSRVRLLSVDDGGVCSVVIAPQRGEGAEVAEMGPVAIDARVRAWLIANRVTLVYDALPQIPLGALREPAAELMHRVDADIIAPLVDREKLVGAIAAAAPPGGRALSDAERGILEEAARATAQALTYVGLLHEAEASVAEAKEVEVAAAVQHARAAGEQKLRYGGCGIVSYYQPAAHFGGHWWGVYELPDGRVLVVLGDVAGQGVSAALVSFTAEGACETAQQMYGASLEVLSLLQLLNASVRGVGGQQYTMSCFVALIDPEALRVTFANAGHPFPYVCRRPKPGGDMSRADLRALVSRGTPLGTADLVATAKSMDLEPNDLLVFYSDSVVDLMNPDRVPYGDRRLQRVLRTRARRAGDRVCRVILDDAVAHYGDRPVDDDINVIAVRLGARA